MKHLSCKIVVAVAVLLFAVAPLSAVAQVGVNTTTPDTTALLDIRFDGTETVGVLLPDVGDEARKSKKKLSDGMVVFDRERKKFYYYNKNLND